MKLMICGKGGSGKSTITSLLARQYAAEGKRVVVVDTDVSNTGLHRILGTNAAPDFTGNFGDRRSMRKAFREARRSGPPHMAPRDAPVLGTWTYDSIPVEYSAEKDGVKLVSIGKIRDATEYGKGRWVGLARRFLGGLDLSENDRVIIDTDAGVEHLARGLARVCDAVFVVVDPTYESVLLAENVSRMLEPMGMPVYFVLNRTNADTSRALRSALPGNFLIAGEFPYDKVIIEAGYEGREMPSGYPPASAVLEILEENHGGLQ